MGRAKRVKIDDVRRDAASPDVETRARALHMLLTVLTRQPEVQPVARELFRRAVEHETDAWMVTNGLVGLERLDGPDAVRPLWQHVLENADVVIAGRIVSSLSDHSHLPMLLKLIDARPEFEFRRGAVYALGRMRDPSVLPLLLRLGDDDGLQPAVVQALIEIGDARALPWLEPLTHLECPLPQLDERGATWTLGDIARQAVRSIEHRTGRRPPPQLPAAPAVATTPPPLPAAAAKPLRHSAWPAFVPLIAAAVQIAWLIGLVILLFILKDTFGTHDAGRVENVLFYVIVFAPSAVGLVAGLWLTAAGRTPRWWEKLMVLVGCFGCVWTPVALVRAFMA